MAIHQGPAPNPTVSSVISTADTWHDIPASGKGTSFTDPLGMWDIPTGGAYIYSDANGLQRIFDIVESPGTVIENIRAEIHGDDPTDGITLEFVTRASAAAAWTSVSSSTFTSGTQAVGGPLSVTATTVAAGTCYGIRITTVKAVSGVKVFRVGYYTTTRVFK